MLNKAVNENGFTLMEILVTIVIIGTLAAISVPMFLEQRKVSQRTAVKNDLMNLSVGFETERSKINRYPNYIPTSFQASDGNVLSVKGGVAPPLPTPTPEPTPISTPEPTPEPKIVIRPTNTNKLFNVTYDTSKTTSEILTSTVNKGNLLKHDVIYFDFQPQTNIKAGQKVSGTMTIRSSKNICVDFRLELHKANAAGVDFFEGKQICITAREWLNVDVEAISPEELEKVTMVAFTPYTPTATLQTNEQILSVSTPPAPVYTTPPPAPVQVAPPVYVESDHMFCIQGYNENNPTEIMHYSSEKRTVEPGICS